MLKKIKQRDLDLMVHLLQKMGYNAEVAEQDSKAQDMLIKLKEEAATDLYHELKAAERDAEYQRKRAENYKRKYKVAKTAAENGVVYYTAVLPPADYYKNETEPADERLQEE